MKNNALELPLEVLEQTIEQVTCNRSRLSLLNANMLIKTRKCQ